jgi:hypothetical protein
MGHGNILRKVLIIHVDIIDIPYNTGVSGVSFECMMTYWAFVSITYDVSPIPLQLRALFLG